MTAPDPSATEQATSEQSASKQTTEPATPPEFDVTKTQIVHEWKHTSPLINCRFNPSGRSVFSSAEDCSIQRWQFDSGECVTLEGHDSWVRDMILTPDGETLVSVASDDQILFWSAAEKAPEPIRSIKAHEGWIRCVDVHPDGDRFATGGNDSLVKLWDLESGDLITQFNEPEHHIYSVRFHPDGKQIIAGELGGKVRVWDIASGKETAVFDAADLYSYNKSQRVDYGGVRSLSLTPDAKQLACGGLHKATNPLGAVSEPLVVIFDWESKEKKRSCIADGVRGVIWQTRYLPDGTLMAASGGVGGGYLLFWSDASEKATHQFKLKDTARGMDVHPDQLHVATTHWDRHLRISRMAG